MFSWKLQRKNGCADVFSKIDVDISPKHCSRCVSTTSGILNPSSCVIGPCSHTLCCILYGSSLSLSPACAPGAHQNYLVCIYQMGGSEISFVHMSCSAGAERSCVRHIAAALCPLPSSLFVRFDLQFTNTTEHCSLPFWLPFSSSSIFICLSRHHRRSKSSPT